MIHGRANRCGGLAVLLLVSLIGLTGCYSYNPEDIAAFIKPEQVNVTAENYVLQPPDEIEVHCTRVPEIHLQKQRIRPDGKVSFEGLGEVDVAGKTVVEVTGVLKTRVAELYKLTGDYPIDVRVSTPTSKVYYMLGQVRDPGPKLYTGRDNVLSALAMAVPTPMAWEEKVLVIRPSPLENVRPRVFKVNYYHIVERGDARMNVLVQEGDIIYVPPTPLASIGMTLEEFIGPIGRAFTTIFYAQRAGGGGGTAY
jgi:protein involved in polysaccharide export with SLBB domain